MRRSVSGPDGRRRSRRLRGFRALRERDFRLYFFGQLCTQMAIWTQRVAQAWLVLELTGSAVALGSVVAMQFLPLLTLSVVSGAVADRLPKRRVLVAAYSASFLVSLAFGLLTLTGRIEVWHVYVLVLLFGIASTLERPAVQALVGLLTSKEDLQSALGLDMTLFGGARIVSTTVAGLVIAAWGVGWCFVVAAIAFLPLIVNLLRIRLPREPEAAQFNVRGVGDDLREGLDYVRRAPALVFPLVSLTFIGLFGYNLSVIFPLLAHDTLAVGAIGFGAMQSAMGIGGLLGALGAAAAKSPTPKTIVISGLGFGSLLVLLGLSSVFLATLLILVLLGAFSIVYMTSSNAFLQSRTHPAYRGRVMSIWVLLMSGITPLGASVTGVLAEIWGVRLVVGVEGALCVLGALAGFGYFRINRASVTAQTIVAPRSARGRALVPDPLIPGSVP